MCVLSECKKYNDIIDIITVVNFKFDVSIFV